MITICIASGQEQSISVDSTKTTYNFLKKEEAGNQIIMYYDIFITLKNSGNSISDDITLDVIDDGGFHFNKQNHTFKPGENKTFIMEDWIFVGEGAHNITINYYPTNESRKNSLNSGKMVLYINENNKNQNDSTPGFEVFLIFMIIIFCSMIIKYIKKIT
jgi:hypothetical protein